MKEKARLVVVTAPDEIAAIRRDELHDPIGGQVLGTWYAYADSLANYRERIARAAGNGPARQGEGNG